jgi:rubrerythrin
VVLHIAPSPNSDLYIKCKRIDDLSTSNMTNTELETSVETENDTSLQMREEQQQPQKQEEQEKIFTDIEHEIGCPRCFDTMTLRSDFDNLYYSCEECGFILYTIKRNL